MKYTKETTDRKVIYAENTLRKNQLNEICKTIDRSVLGNEEAAIQLVALKRLKKSQLSSWRQFRTKNGLSNDALKGI